MVSYRDGYRGLTSICCEFALGLLSNITGYTEINCERLLRVTDNKV